jgi:hypothetical protein
MEKKYFFVMASDGANGFQPTGQYNHKFYGVADTDSKEEYDRLKLRGCRELTKEEFDEESKKKAGLQNLWDEFRPITEVHRVQLAEIKQSAELKTVTLDSVKVASQVPTKKT